MEVNTATAHALERAAGLLRYQNKQFDIKRLEEHLRMEKNRLERLKPIDPTKGKYVDIKV